MPMIWTEPAVSLVTENLTIYHAYKDQNASEGWVDSDWTPGKMHDFKEPAEEEEGVE